jgi:hypothetical protein
LGEKVTVGCSHRGRIWSYRIASDVSQWVGVVQQRCDEGA